MSVLIVIEHDNQEIKLSSLSTISAATQLNLKISCLVVGFHCDSVIEQLQKLDCIEQIYVADGEYFSHANAETLSAIIQTVIEGVTHLLAPATTFGKDSLPRLAATLDVGQVSDIIGIIDQQTYIRPIYAGNALATVRSDDAVQVITVRATAFSPVIIAEQINASITVNHLPLTQIKSRSQFIRLEAQKSDRPELNSAKVIVSGGRGLKDQVSFERLIAIADRLDAAIGASRAAVDAGLAPNDWQVGQTGKVVAPALYIAVGISGAIQHVAGMKDSGCIVAINKDPDAPIFDIADYGLVADIEQLLPEWETVLDEMGYQ